MCEFVAGDRLAGARRTEQLALARDRAGSLAINPLPQPETLRLRLDHGSSTSVWSREITIPENGTARVELELQVTDRLSAGRHIVPLIVTSANGDIEDGGDSFVVLEIVEK